MGLEDFIYYLTYSERSCLLAQMVKNLPEVRETWVQSLGQEDPLENEMATSCLGNPMDGGAWQTTVHGVTNSQTRLSDSLSLSMIISSCPHVDANAIIFVFSYD